MLGKICNTFDILQVLVEFHRRNDNLKPSLSKIGIDAHVKFKIGKTSFKTKDVIVMLNFVWHDSIAFVCV